MSEIDHILVEQLVEGRFENPGNRHLSRERRIAAHKLRAQGYTNEVIAYRLKVSSRQVVRYFSAS